MVRHFCLSMSRLSNGDRKVARAGVSYCPVLPFVSYPIKGLFIEAPFFILFINLFSMSLSPVTNPILSSTSAFEILKISFHLQNPFTIHSPDSYQGCLAIKVRAKNCPLQDWPTGHSRILGCGPQRGLLKSSCGWNTSLPAGFYCTSSSLGVTHADSGRTLGPRTEVWLQVSLSTHSVCL